MSPDRGAATSNTSRRPSGESPKKTSAMLDHARPGLERLEMSLATAGRQRPQRKALEESSVGAHARAGTSYQSPRRRHSSLDHESPCAFEQHQTLAQLFTERGIFAHETGATPVLITVSKNDSLPTLTLQEAPE